MHRCKVNASLDAVRKRGLSVSLHVAHEIALAGVDGKPLRRRQVQSPPLPDVRGPPRWWRIAVPYAVAHELGHLMMDKLFVLKRDGLPLPAQAEYQHHYHGPATAGFPENQNLMRPSATKNRGIKEPKRIWNVKDKDGYNQAADLVSNLQGLQIP